eukprot:TRINITY_DN2939_c0_g1_i2.p1 TRINITY_DN2939_c0_g1~~TRINITY_DN2939_c0_g1_i2.p1  ORF type:complete len:120 (-),score=32.18 TRINITY_DN2939_c0_g1_i2:51-410(-)
MLPDVIEMDQLQTALRREGLFFSYTNFMEKLAISAGLAGSSYALGAAGYESFDSESDSGEDTQPEAVKLILRMLYSLVPIAFLLSSLFVMRYYPITEEVHKKNLAALAQQRAERAAQGK